ncbi:MAG: hypothetical protein L6Q97_16975 [Thermoanaerobaculia bacterium]|nr:hypothetical protein [Thermoanaerobaculia bacterium]
MIFAHIFLHSASATNDYLVGFLLCIIPFILGWLAAYAYYKVGALREDNAALTAKVNDQTNEITQLRMRISALEADVETRDKQLHKVKDDLIMCESERNALREQVGDKAGAKAGGAKTVAAAAPKTITFNGTKYKWDDLKIVEGIGPKIAEMLNNAGITTWAQLAVTSPYQLREILDAGGPQYNVAVPDSWPHQADLADKEDWDGLKKLQEELTGGRAE